MAAQAARAESARSELEGELVLRARRMSRWLPSSLYSHWDDRPMFQGVGALGAQAQRCAPAMTHSRTHACIVQAYIMGRTALRAALTSSLRTTFTLWCGAVQMRQARDAACADAERRRCGESPAGDSAARAAAHAAGVHVSSCLGSARLVTGAVIPNIPMPLSSNLQQVCACVQCQS